MKFNFRKISAIFASAVMLGSIMGIAAAAAFPTDFTSATPAIVYGASADPMDQTQASSISTYLAGKIPSAGGAPTGESVLIAKSSDKFNMGDIMSSLQTTLDYEDLPTLLAKGTYVASDNDEFKYEQKITLGNAALTHFRDSDYETLAGLASNTPVVGFKVNSSEFILNYTLDFTSDAESDIVSSEMDDLEGSDMPLFGKTYYISDFDLGTTTNYFGKIDLLDSAEIGNVAQGETATVAGKQVTIDWIDNNEVVFMVDGQRVPSSGKLLKGGSSKLSDGSYLGVRDISKLEVSGELGSASFSIGSGKLEIPASTATGNEIKLNDVAVKGIKAWVYMASGNTSTLAKLNKIEIEWRAEEEMFLTSDSELVIPGFGGLKFTMNDLVKTSEEKIIIQKSDDTSIQVTMPMKDGDVSFNILYANATGDFVGIGKANDDRLATSGNNTLYYIEKLSGADYNTAFIASYNTTTQSESYLLKTSIAYDSTSLRDEVKISKKTSDGWVVACEDKTNNDDCTIGDITLTILNVSDETAGNETVTLKAGSKVSFHTAFTKGGLMIYLPYTVNATLGGAGSIVVDVNQSLTAHGVLDFWNYSTSTFAGQGVDTYYLNFDSEDKDDTIAAGSAFNLTIDDSSNKLLVTQVSGSGTGGAHGLEIGSSSGTYEAHIGGDTDPRILHYTKSDNDDYAEVYSTAGNSEVYAEVFVTESASTVGAAGSMVFTDAQKSSWQDKNVILVGGSCINSATATALGVAYGTCESAFTTATGAGTGQYIIQSVGNAFTSGKIALVVAGYNKEDTAAGASKLIGQPTDIDTTAGNKYLGIVGVAGASTISKV